jgi:hypothetical protein
MLKPAAEDDGQRGAKARNAPKSDGGVFRVCRFHGFVVVDNGRRLSFSLSEVSRILPAS